MRGPGNRLNLEIRRLWRCPACGAECKAGADQEQVVCDCRPEPTFMKLQSEPVSRVLKGLDPRPEPAPVPKRSTDLPPRSAE